MLAGQVGAVLEVPVRALRPSPSSLTSRSMASAAVMASRFSAERAATIQRIQFSQPLDGQVSDLKGTGDLASALSNA